MLEVDKNLNNENWQMQGDMLARIKNMQNAFYAGLDPRRRKEVADSGMIQEDHRAMSNLPENFTHTEYPTRKTAFYSDPYIDSME